jgi:hypothetical protein
MKIHDPIWKRRSLRGASVRPIKTAPRTSLMLLCGGWFPAACGDRQRIRPDVGRAAAPRAHLARLTAGWFRLACDGRLPILLSGRLEMDSQAWVENGPQPLYGEKEPTVSVGSFSE